MATQGSGGKDGRSTGEQTGDASVAPDAEGTGTLGGDTVVVGVGAMGEDSVAAEPDSGSRVTIEPGETSEAEIDEDDPLATERLEASAEETDAEAALSEPGDAAQSDADPGDETPEEPDSVEPKTDPETDIETSVDEVAADAPTEAPVATAPPPPQSEPRSSGFGGLLIGGVLAAAIGYAAAYFGLSPAQESGSDPALTAALEQIEAQSGTLAALQEQLAALAEAEPPAPPEVDLSGVETAIATVSEGVDEMSGALAALSDRVAALEDRPVFTGEVDQDSAAMAAAVEALEARLTEERETAAQAVADAQAAQEAAVAELQAASDAAQAAIAEAEARAANVAAATQAQAALSRVQIAMAAGDPFADALADLGIDVPDALSAVAESGVATLEDLQAGFPEAARLALPIALRETAGESTTDRIGAFLMAQVGGRSVEPREGSDPDAILSRAEAAAASGDIAAALVEIESLPPGAQAPLAGWVDEAQSRAAADAALAELAAALDN